MKPGRKGSPIDLDDAFVLDEDVFEDEFLFGNEFFFVEDVVEDVVEDEATFDELCSPGLPDGIFIPGCIFSDPLEDDDIEDFRFIDDNFDGRRFDHHGGFDFIDLD